mgnify:CR=1 FL=1
MAIRLLQFMEFCCQGTWLTGKNLRGADALDGLKLLGESCIIVSVQRDECVRYREGGMSAGDKALDDIHSFGNG